MKDPKGHGSNSRGGGTFDRLNAMRKRDGYKPMSESRRGVHNFLDYMAGDGPKPDVMVAAELARGNPKADAAPVHAGAAGRNDSFFGRSASGARAAHKEAQEFQRTRVTRGPHYLDPKRR